jgi:Uri superfamily endonuclease
VLIIRLHRDTHLKVGGLGELTFKKGFYAYVGSAQKNFTQRIQRHFRRNKRKFWHIDYLLDAEEAEIVQVLFKETNKTEECAVAKEIAERGEAINGFGCSDCHCVSHLFRIADYRFLRDSMQALNLKSSAQL